MTDASPALLLLLSLGLCCPGAQSQKYVTVPKFYDSKITHPERGKPLKLECTSSADSGISWIRQDKAGTLHFIVYISALSRTTFEGSQKTSSRFQVSKSGTSYRLQVNSFEAQDEGIYFCTVNFNQVLYFSSGLRIFFPVTTTAAPVTTVPTTQSAQVTKRNVCLQSHEAETSKEKELNFFCEIFIWVPLAAACILLLIALVITIVLCQKTRRRRCRCKRPANGKPKMKPNMPNQQI